MANFPNYQPSYSANKKSAPRITTIQFGDGYQQLIRFGLNQNPKEWSLSFDVADIDANIIEAFLDYRANDAASFDWTPPDSNTSYKWICSGWTRELYDFERSRIDVTFMQVFEP